MSPLQHRNSKESRFQSLCWAFCPDLCCGITLLSMAALLVALGVPAPPHPHPPHSPEVTGESLFPRCQHSRRPHAARPFSPPLAAAAAVEGREA